MKRSERPTPTVARRSAAPSPSPRASAVGKLTRTDPRRLAHAVLSQAGPVQLVRAFDPSIPWKSFSGGAQLTDITNQNFVFRVDFGADRIVVKAYRDGGAACEIAATRLITGMKLPGVEAPAMRFVREDERDACYQVLDALHGKPLLRLPQLAVMDFMEGVDLGQARSGAVDGDVLACGADKGRRQLANTATLLAFHHMVKANDRFAEPPGMRAADTSGNVSNIRFARDTDRVQAIDTTLPSVSRQVIDFASGCPDRSIADQQAHVGAHIDDLVLHEGRSELATTLARQLGLDPDDVTVQAAIRQGFVAGLAAIGSSTCDFRELIIGVGENRARLLTEPVASDPAYAAYLEGMRAFFRDKSRLAATVDSVGGADPLRGDALALTRAAAEMALGQQPDRTLVARYRKTRHGVHGVWPPALRALHAAKNRIGADSTQDELRRVLALVAPAFTAVIGQSGAPAPARVIRDLCRTIAKVIDRIGRRLAAPMAPVRSDDDEGKGKGKAADPHPLHLTVG